MVAQALRDYKKKHKKFVEQLPKIKFGVVNETTVDYWCDLTREKYEEITDVLYTLNIVICIAFKKTLIYILQIKHVIIIKNVTLFCTIYPPINIAWISLLSS